jgi:hypothetical protein
VGVNFFYFGGPLTLTGFYENADINNPVNTLLANNQKYWMLLGAYDFGMVKPYLSYGEKKIDDTASTKGKTVPGGRLCPPGQWQAARRVGEDRVVHPRREPQDLHAGLRLQPVQAHRRVRHVHERQDHALRSWPNRSTICGSACCSRGLQGVGRVDEKHAAGGQAWAPGFALAAFR